MEANNISRRRRIFILCICCISVLMVSLDNTIVNVALPSIQRELHTHISGAQWTVDAYLLVLASLLLLSGSIADRFGRKRIFRTGLVIFSLGSLLCSIAPSVGWLIIFRMLQAVGGSMLNPVALSIIDNTFTARARAKAIGVWSGVVGISMAAGPVVGGILVSTVGWRSIFWINIPIGLIALLLTSLYVPESKALKPRRQDPIGQLLIIGFLATLVYGIIKAPELGWGASLILGCFTASAVFFVTLLHYENTRADPLIELRFFHSAPFSGAIIIAICAFIGVGGFLFLNTLYLQDVRLYSALRAGLYLLPLASAMFISGPISGYIVSRRGPRVPLVAGGFAVAISATFLALSMEHLSNTKLFIGYTLSGIGLGLINAAITNTALSGMPRSEAGVAAATTSTSRQIGQSLGVAVIGSVLARHTLSVTPGNVFTTNAQISWWILTGTGLAVLITAIITTSDWARKTAEKYRVAIEAADQVAS